MKIVIEGYNEYNPISQDMYLEICDRFTEFESSKDLRVAVITGAGDKHFSAGGNLKRANNLEAFFDPKVVLENFWNEGSYDPKEWIDGYIRTALIEVKKPVVAAVRGSCLGAALMLLGSRTDIRIAGESAEFGFTEIRHGLGGPAAIISRLRDQIPYTSLMWLAFGQHINAHEAHRIGLVNELVPDDQVLDRAMEVARAIAEVPPLAIRAEKQSLLRTQHQPFKEAVQYGTALFSMIQMSADAREGVQAFVEKRRPNFVGS
ncbi:TPA: enoyl-CoA hydratase-related protein [Burkholderia cepacia]|uniref:enoyl-CoA hydratase/isomerase family protein n=1 Tax=Burkholderia cepacia TaxID=292 RepID=UPI001CF3E399|nr:enoyl-CoA hydratase-related protein [Burkholderia cepacia]MCA8357560.1 enoyl-CoA hydratase/isomerase family protein [Burkholderia cepacia]HDR9761120.1 enoyl-CoA hydratase/isomerase family protein [Burkholderia cepacia ATCC 25416]HDV6368329.1 enoyl-CoA hydratase/isomerase family protein [Burkholderia cepacia]